MVIIIIAFTALISLVALKNHAVMEKLWFSPFEMNVGKDWMRFITHGFVHGSLGHLAINMFVLWMFGTRVEDAFADLTHSAGYLPFILLYLGGIVLSSIPGYYKHKWDPTYKAVGASGATSAVVFSSILLFPTDKLMLLILPIPTSAWIFGILYLGYEFYMSKRGKDGIAHDAHFYGALYGIAFTCVIQPHAIASFITAITGH